MLVALAVVAASATLGAREAAAHPGITGYSGKPYNGAAETCTTNCHAAGGTKPTLTITVPATVQAGSTTTVTVVVAGTRARTSLNAAFSDGVKTVKGTNTDTPLPVQEPTEVGAVVPAPSGNTATYSFAFIAPKVNGPITMWVAGMSSNGAGTNGDGVANATRMITVTGAGTDAGVSDAGGSSGGNAGGDASASGSSGSSGSSGDSNGADAGSGGGASSSSGHATSGGDNGEAGGCAVTTAAGAANGASFGASVFALALIGSLVSLRRRLRDLRSRTP